MGNDTSLGGVCEVQSFVIERPTYAVGDGEGGFNGVTGEV